MLKVYGFSKVNAVARGNTRDLRVLWALEEMQMPYARRHLGNLDRWLDGREFIATKAFTVADILMAHVLDEIKDKSLIQPYARVASYRDRCFARPAWKRTLDSYLARVEAG